MSALEQMATNFPVAAICVLMIVAAVVDGWKLKVPNWLTYPMIFSGWLYWTYASATTGDWSLLGNSIGGTFVGVLLLFFVFMVGGVGAGDVKMYAGFGAWMVPLTWFGYYGLAVAFAVSVVTGGIMAALMIWWQGTLIKNIVTAQEIVNDLTTKTVAEADAAARKRKSSLQLLPYGIPLCVGSLLYIAYVIPVAQGAQHAFALMGN